MTLFSFYSWGNHSKKLWPTLLFFPSLFRIWTFRGQQWSGIFCVLSDIQKRKNITLSLARSNAVERKVMPVNFSLDFSLTNLKTLIVIYFSRTQWGTLCGEVPVALWRRRHSGGVCICISAQSCPSFAIPWTVAHQAPLSMEFSRQECWSESPKLSPSDCPSTLMRPRYHLK